MIQFFPDPRTLLSIGPFAIRWYALTFLGGALLTYGFMDIGEYEKTRAAFTLMQELGKGEQSAAERGWIRSVDAEKALGS